MRKPMLALAAALVVLGLAACGEKEEALGPGGAKRFEPPGPSFSSFSPHAASPRASSAAARASVRFVMRAILFGSRDRRGARRAS